MSEPSFSPLAAADLEGTVECIARDKPQAAIAFVKTLKDKYHTLTRYPQMGQSRNGLIPGLRVFPVGNYVIYYREESGSIRIERVLHGARDADALFR